MKKIMMLTLILIPMLTFATSYNTIAVDGSTVGWQADEYLGQFSSNLYGDLTWDANNFYFRTNDNALVNTSSNCDVYFDTDPQSNPTSGSGTAIPANTESGPPTLPFNADFGLEIYGSSTDNVQGSGVIYTYGSSWSSVSYSGTGGNAEAWINSSCNEVRISRSALGNPTQIYIIMFVANNTQGGNVWSVWPTNNSSGNAPNFSHYYGYDNLGSGIAPNSSSYNDNSLPVELSTFTTRSSSRGVELSWTTESEIENQGFIVSRKTAHQRWQELASFASTKALEGQGSTTRATTYSYVDQTVQAGVSYVYQLSDVDYQGHRTDHEDLIQELTYLTPEQNSRPQVLELKGLYPNPFNPSTTLSYDLTEAVELMVNIYNLQGTQVWSYHQSQQPAGQNYSLNWNGRDQSGTTLTSGIYLVRIQAGNQILSRKVTLLR